MDYTVDFCTCDLRFSLNYGWSTTRVDPDCVQHGTDRQDPTDEAVPPSPRFAAPSSPSGARPAGTGAVGRGASPGPPDRPAATLNETWEIRPPRASTTTNPIPNVRKGIMAADPNCSKCHGQGVIFTTGADGQAKTVPCGCSMPK